MNQSTNSPEYAFDRFHLRPALPDEANLFYSAQDTSPALTRRIMKHRRKDKQEGFGLNRHNGIFEVEICNTGIKGNETHAELELPTPWGEFHDALQKARIEDGHHCRITVRKNRWDNLTSQLLGRPHDLYELNLLAGRLTELTLEEASAFDALLEVELNNASPPFPPPAAYQLYLQHRLLPACPRWLRLQSPGGIPVSKQNAPGGSHAIAGCG